MKNNIIFLVSVLVGLLTGGTILLVTWSILGCFEDVHSVWYILTLAVSLLSAILSAEGFEAHLTSYSCDKTKNK